MYTVFHEYLETVSNNTIRTKRLRTHDWDTAVSTASKETAGAGMGVVIIIDDAKPSKALAEFCYRSGNNTQSKCKACGQIGVIGAQCPGCMHTIA